MSNKSLSMLKKDLLNWTDFYGQDIVQTDLIEEAKTRKQLKEVLKSHIRFLHNQHIDAINHADNFMKKLFGE